MKTIIKIIWFSVAFSLGIFLFEQFFTMDKLILHIDKLAAFPAIYNISSNLITNYLRNVEFVIIFTIMFLGLDIIHGDIKGFIAGPFKLILNAILYLVGFSIIFSVFNIFGIGNII